MSLDPEHHRAFLACENNLMTVDLDKHTDCFLPLARCHQVRRRSGPHLCRVLQRCHPSSIKMIQTTIVSWKIFPFSGAYLAVDPKTQFTHQSRKTENRSREWSSMRQPLVLNGSRLASRGGELRGING